jgi:hypothetical protein
MGNVVGVAFLPYGNFDQAIITDIIMGNFGLGAFYSPGKIRGGIINNITMGDGDNAFYSGESIESTISNIITGDVNYSFYSVSSISSKISYVKSNGPIFISGTGNFSSELLDCELDCRGKTTTVINKVSSVARIERCKLLSDSGYPTISATASGTPVQILYTVINDTLTNISATPSTNNYNIYTW